MKKVTFVAEYGNVDSQANQFIVDGIKIPDKQIVVLEDFDVKKVIGHADVFKEDGCIKVSMELDEKLMSYYPAIGVKVIKSNKKMLSGGTITTESELFAIGISSTENADPTIKRIIDQQ